MRRGLGDWDVGRGTRGRVDVGLGNVGTWGHGDIGMWGLGDVGREHAQGLKDMGGRDWRM